MFIYTHSILVEQRPLREENQNVIQFVWHFMVTHAKHHSEWAEPRSIEMEFSYVLHIIHCFHFSISKHIYISECSSAS